MKEKSKSEVSIIGGADGPTSIFIAGRTRKKPLKVRIRNIIYRYRRKIVEKKVVADSHTLDELVQYAMNRFFDSLLKELIPDCTLIYFRTEFPLERVHENILQATLLHHLFQCQLLEYKALSHPSDTFQ
jgi:hypothetical protein